MAAHPTRRVVLTAAATLPLAAAMPGCVNVLGAPPSPAPDVGLLRSAIATEQLMISRYAAVLRTVSGSRPAGPLAAVLRPLLAEHRAHYTQLRSRLIVPAGSPGAAARRPPRSPPPAAIGAAITFLRAAELSAAADMLSRLPRAPASLAQLFASISASEATHVPVLDAAAGGLGQQAAR